MNWWAIVGYSSHACAKISFCDDVIYTDHRVPRNVTRVAKD